MGDVRKKGITFLNFLIAEPETEPEETLQKEPDPGQDPDAEPKAEAEKPTGEKEPADGKE